MSTDMSTASAASESTATSTTEASGGLSSYLEGIEKGYDLADFADFGNLLGELNEEGYGTILEYLVEQNTSGNTFTDTLDVNGISTVNSDQDDLDKLNDTIAEYREEIELWDTGATEDSNDDLTEPTDEQRAMVNAYDLGTELLKGLPTNVSNDTKMGILTMTLSTQGVTMVMELASTYNQNLQTVGAQMSNTFKSNVRNIVSQLGK